MGHQKVSVSCWRRRAIKSGGGGIRTPDQELMSLLLCHLSYAAKLVIFIFLGHYYTQRGEKVNTT